MSDAAITIIVAGVINIATMLIGFLTLWIKLRYAGTKAEEAATKAGVVEKKIDDNTSTTKEVNIKADTIVDQTNGNLSATRMLAEGIAQRVSKLEDYNHNSSHRVLEALNVIHLKLTALVAVQPRLAEISTASAGPLNKDK